MQYLLVLSKHQETILDIHNTTRPIDIFEGLTDEEIEIVKESGETAENVIHPHMVIEFTNKIKDKDIREQLGILAELFRLLDNHRMKKACLEGDIKKVEKYTSTPKFGSMLMKHTTVIIPTSC